MNKKLIAAVEKAINERKVDLYTAQSERQSMAIMKEMENLEAHLAIFQEQAGADSQRILGPDYAPVDESDPTPEQIAALAKNGPKKVKK